MAQSGIRAFQVEDELDDSKKRPAMCRFRQTQRCAMHFRSCSFQVRRAGRNQGDELGLGCRCTRTCHAALLIEVMRIGNTRDPETKMATSLNANDPPLPEGAHRGSKSAFPKVFSERHFVFRRLSSIPSGRSQTFLAHCAFSGNIEMVSCFMQMSALC